MHPTLVALKHAYRAARTAAEAELRGTGLTAAQMDVLKLLVGPPGSAAADQRAVQADLGVTSATLTRLLAGMERRGLVTRAAHPTDARGKTVVATPKARRLFAAVMAAGEARFAARLLRGFTAAEVRALTDMLRRVGDNMADG